MLGTQEQLPNVEARREILVLTVDLVLLGYEGELTAKRNAILAVYGVPLICVLRGIHKPVTSKHVVGLSDVLLFSGTSFGNSFALFVVYLWPYSLTKTRT